MHRDRHAGGRAPGPTPHRRWLIAALLSPAVPSMAGAAASGPAKPPLLRISTENVEAHFQTQVIQRFVDALRRKTLGRLDVDFRHSAQWYRDHDVVRALSEGKVEMAVPGNWQFERYDPHVSALTLPMFLGRSAQEHYQLRDGPIGQRVGEHLAQAVEVVVLGRWVDLGQAHLFTTRQPVYRHADLAGLRIRIAGGVAIAAQLTAVGAKPVLVAWPDLSNVLAQGRLDGVLTTYETVASARLWQQGLRYATEVRAYFAQYIPVVSKSFWQRLPLDVQQTLRSTWEDVVEQSRADAAQAQLRAKDQLRAQGITVIEPSQQDLLAWRRQVSAQQTALVRQLGVPEDLVRQAERQLP